MCSLKKNLNVIYKKNSQRKELMVWWPKWFTICSWFHCLFSSIPFGKRDILKENKLNTDSELTDIKV